MFQMCGVFAEFEPGMIRERINAGLARARAKGTKLGWLPVEPYAFARHMEGDFVVGITGAAFDQRIYTREQLLSELLRGAYLAARRPERPR
jgi:DNA invertase Pin-like site-specific DNA recombinase